MNWAALIKHIVSGFLNGFLAIAGADAFIEGVNLEGWEMALAAGMVGALRALQEFLSPTSYIRPPASDTAKRLAGS